MRFFVLIIISLFIGNIHAQQMSWKKHLKVADELYKQGKYADAGEHYQSAWQQKAKKTELIYKAAECFNKVKDYRKAAEAYLFIKDYNDKFDLVGLKYARALKQDGQFELAGKEFVHFIDIYQGEDKDIVSKIVENEIKGCEVAAVQAAQAGESSIEIDHLSENINTPEQEFAPIPFSDDIIYFSSTMKGQSKIFRSQRRGGFWSKAQLPQSFPIEQNGNFGSGAFSPDNTRFYFTLCEDNQALSPTDTKCAIHVTQREGANWSKPTKLREYINSENATALHPFVVHQDGKEILYFASNRGGTKGGLDLWYAMREINSTSLDFTLPKNLGSNVNTIGDEISPFYDANNGVLYFSSNGHPTIGGFDIFESKGSQLDWQQATNLAAPINSAADDFNYVKKATSGGFFVSNRLFGLEKITTSELDIFSFDTPDQRVVLRGSVFDRKNTPLNEVEVSLYEKLRNGQLRLLNSKVFNDGNYEFGLIPNKELIVEARREGYATSKYEFNTYNFDTTTRYGEPIYMDKSSSAGLTSSQSIYKTNPKPTAPVSKPQTNSTAVASTENVAVMPSKPTNKVDKVKETVSNTGSIFSPSPTADKAKITTSTTSPSTSITSPNKPSTTTINSSAPSITSPSSPTVTSPSNTSTVTTTNSTSSSTAPASSSSSNYVPSTTTSNSTNSSSTIVSPSGSSYSPPTTTTSPSYPMSKASSTGGTIVSPSGNNYTSASTPYIMDTKDGGKIKTSAPKNDGIYYKIQLIAVRNHSETHQRYNPIKHLGRFDTELIISKGLTRVLLADFYTVEEAERMMNKVRKYRAFNRAFIVRYENGQRMGRWHF